MLNEGPLITNSIRAWTAIRHSKNTKTVNIQTALLPFSESDFALNMKT
jgi:hypothetical protein